VPEVEAEREYPPEPEAAPAGGLAELVQNKFVWAAAAIIVLMLLVLLFR
jgi:hypothetical protein